MIPAGELVILDTGVLVQLVRYNAAGKRIDEQLRLTGRQERPLISVVTVGELHGLALALGWGREKVRQLSELVRQLVVVVISRTDVIHRYAQIDEFSERQVKPARPLGQNDMWIAATAAAYDAHLVTTDTDFDHLTPRFSRRTRIDPRTGEVQT